MFTFIDVLKFASEFLVLFNDECLRIFVASNFAWCLNGSGIGVWENIL